MMCYLLERSDYMNYICTEQVVDMTAYYFSNLYEYDYVISFFKVPEGQGVDMMFYNSPLRRSFNVEISYDEKTDIDYISDKIIQSYLHRLDKGDE